MSARRILFLQFLVLFVLTLIHVFGDLYFLYWKYRWLDVVAHFLGGLWVGLLALWVTALLEKRLQFLGVLSVVLAFGVAWEFFEIAFGATDFPAEILDTIKDLVMDLVGGSAAYFAVTRLSHILGQTSD